MSSTPRGSAQPLLRELIDIPERVQQGDFVLRLTEGVARRQATLNSYVITPQLRVAFDQALGLIGSALGEHSSKASYLHGSFGSGKSHFMAVLHALLDGDVDARSRRELADLVARHRWLADTHFLLVPYHLIGAESLEAAILGGYVTHVRDVHPGAPLPAVYRTQGLVEDARAIRDRLGTEAFLAALPSAEPNGAWGDVDSGWSAAQLDAAFAAAPDSDLAQRLVNDVVPVFMPNFVDSVVGAANAFVPLDQGLAAITRHAKSLGYHGVVLFLDELVLWLAGKISDPAFVGRETEKVAKLVESGDAHRAIPVISFIARQRDLRELVGTERTGAEALSFQDQLSYWDGRFATVPLEDRNLPLIAERRILKPRDGAAEQISAAFQRTSALPAATRDVLLSDGNSDSFRRTYPFSPAFMETLVHVSSALQRERTALKLMRQILVQRRDDLCLGDLVPFGDLFDAIADGHDQPFTEKLRHQFDQARALYQRTLRPMLLGQRGLSEEQAGGQADADPALLAAFRADDRLIKTLLLAALAPGVTALRGMTARRLTALNHGTIRSMIPGQEVAEVTRRLRSWASQVAELKVGGEDDPSVALALVGVDLQAILDRVTHVDNQAARRQLVRDLLFRELGINDAGTLELEHPVVWRGGRRHLEIVYGNVRDPAELRDEIFEPSQNGRWRLVIDYPFDATTHSAVEDRHRVEQLRTKAARRCVAWLPAFVTGNVLGKIANLVRIDYVLTGTRLDEAASHLGADDRQRARELLRNQGDSLRSELKFVLRQAYGLAMPDEKDVLTWTDHLVSRDPMIHPKLDVGRPFAEALTHLVDQLYCATYPEHPDFDRQRRGTVVSTAELRTVLDVIRRAADQPQGRTETERTERAALQRIAHALKLGDITDGPFVLSRHWEAELERRAAREGFADADIPVREIRGWIADLGLETRVANLVIATYAELTQRAWLRGQRVIEPPATVDGVGDDLHLRRQQLPGEQEWTVAVERAGALFGYASPSRVVSPRAVARFGGIATQIAALRTPAAELIAVLDNYRDRLGIAPDAPRLVTAETAGELLETLHRCPDPTALVRALASMKVDIPLVVLSKSLMSASPVADALRGADWQVLDQLPGLDRPEAEPIRDTLRRKASADENAAALRDALAEARRRTLNLIVTKPAPAPPHSSAPPQTTRTVRGLRDEVLAELARELPAGSQIEITYRIVTPDEGRQ